MKKNYSLFFWSVASFYMNADVAYTSTVPAAVPAPAPVPAAAAPTQVTPPLPVPAAQPPLPQVPVSAVSPMSPLNQNLSAPIQEYIQKVIEKLGVALIPDLDFFSHLLVGFSVPKPEIPKTGYTCFNATTNNRYFFAKNYGESNPSAQSTPKRNLSTTILMKIGLAVDPQEVDLYRRLLSQKKGDRYKYTWVSGSQSAAFEAFIVARYFQNICFVYYPDPSIPSNPQAAPQTSSAVPNAVPGATAQSPIPTANPAGVITPTPLTATTPTPEATAPVTSTAATPANTQQNVTPGTAPAVSTSTVGASQSPTPSTAVPTAPLTAAPTVATPGTLGDPKLSPTSNTNAGPVVASNTSLGTPNFTSVILLKQPS